jgi:hypothetical protein
MTRNRILNYLIAAVWIANGLFCKVLNLVPRHREIVARIIGNAHAGVITRAIGFSEIAMAAWILMVWSLYHLFGTGKRQMAKAEACPLFRQMERYRPVYQ